MKTHKILLALLVLIGTFYLLDGRVEAATITVNSTDDTVVYDGTCTLREAVIAADTDTSAGAGECAAGSGNDVINIPNGIYTLTSDLDLGGTSITLNGTWRMGTQIKGNGQYGLHYDGGSGLRDLTLQHLMVTETTGLRSTAAAAANVIIDDTVWTANSISTSEEGVINLDGYGGTTDFMLSNSAIYANNGVEGCGVRARFMAVVTIASTQIYANECSDSNSDDASVLYLQGQEAIGLTELDVYENVVSIAVSISSPDIDIGYTDVYDNIGGGISANVNGALGAFSLHHSSVVNNNGDVAMLIGNDGGGYVVNVSNFTIAGNTSSYSAFTFFSDETNPISGTVKNVTVANNIRSGNLGFSVPAAMTVLSQSQIAPTFTLENVLFAHNLDETTPRNCSTPAVPILFQPISIGHNLSDDDTCGDAFDQSSDINNVNAHLGTLTQDNATWVVPLQASSPANDGGATVAGMIDDQRSTDRPQNGAFDIGAYEVLGAYTPDPGVGNGSNNGSNAGAAQTPVVPGVPDTGFQLLLNNPYVVVGLTSVSACALLCMSRRAGRNN